MLNLSNKQFNYLIYNSELEKINVNALDIVVSSLLDYKINNLNLDNKQLKYFISKLELSNIKDKENLENLLKLKYQLLNEELLDKINIKNEQKKLNKI